MTGEGDMGVPNQFPDRLREAMALLYRPTPHTPESLAEFNRLRAREMQRAEARRQSVAPDDLLRGDA